MKTASWIIRVKETKAVVKETFEPIEVRRLNTEKYEAIPIETYLQEINAKIKAAK